MMNKITNTCVTLFLICGGVLFWQPSLAQDVARNETVGNRARPELDALGIHVGAFNLFPKLAVSGISNSNIYADDDFKESDTIIALSPSVEFTSDWGIHKLSFGADADIFRFSDNDSEDHEDYSVWGEGRFDISRFSVLLGDASHERLHEARDSPDDVRGFEPTIIDRDQLSIAYEIPRGVRRFHTQLTGEFRSLDFEDSIGENGTINNDDRDRRKLTGVARFGYNLAPAYSVFLQGSAYSVEYEDELDDRGFDRSSTGYEVAIGTTLDFAGKTFGDIFVGYLSEKYDDPGFDKIDGLSFGAEVSWNISGLTTLGVSARREVEPTTIGETAGTEVTRFRLGVDHELLRNFVLSLDIGTSKEDFQGIDREDDIRSVNFSARYMMNRRIELVFGYRYSNRDSEPSPNTGIEFTRNIISLTVEGHL